MSYEPIWDGRSGYGGKGRHRLRNFILILLALGILFFAALEIYIGVHSRSWLAGEPKVMVIFGCKVETWGPSVLLQDRLDTALAYLEDHPDMPVVVTGGKGDDEHQSEAQCMYDYLAAHGINGENIYREDRARNTWQNVNYTLDLMKNEGWSLTDDVILVSSGFHLSRIEMLWDRARIVRLPGEVYNDQYISTLSAPVSHFPSEVKMFFREPLALVKSFLFDR